MIITSLNDQEVQQNLNKGVKEIPKKEILSKFNSLVTLCG
jgi:hypothetical protein